MAKKKRTIDLSQPLTDQVSQLVTKDDLDFWSKPLQQEVKAPPSFAASLGDLPTQKAILRIMANQTITKDTSKKARLAIQQARMWYTGSKTAKVVKKGSVKDIISSQETPPPAPPPARGGGGGTVITGDQAETSSDAVSGLATTKRGSKKVVFDPAKSFDQAVKAVTLGGQIGPTRKAAQTGKAKAELTAIAKTLPQPGSLPWAEQRIADTKAQEAMDLQKWKLDQEMNRRSHDLVRKAASFLNTPAGRTRSTTKNPLQYGTEQAAKRKTSKELEQAGYIPGTPAYKPKPTRLSDVAKNKGKKKYNKPGR